MQSQILADKLKDFPHKLIVFLQNVIFFGLSQISFSLTNRLNKIVLCRIHLENAILKYHVNYEPEKEEVFVQVP